jgi:hypothetical protein
MALEYLKKSGEIAEEPGDRTAQSLDALGAIAGESVHLGLSGRKIQDYGLPLRAKAKKIGPGGRCLSVVRVLAC